MDMNERRKIPVCLQGCAGELAVAADLLLRGYHVFRTVCANAPVDLIIMDDAGQLLRVEVKTGTAQPRHEKYDVLARVLRDGSVEYTRREDKDVVYVPDVGRTSKR